MLWFFCDGWKREVGYGMLCDVTAGLNVEGHFLLFTSGWYNVHVKPWSKICPPKAEICKLPIESLDLLSLHQRQENLKPVPEELKC